MMDRDLHESDISTAKPTPAKRRVKRMTAKRLHAIALAYLDRYDTSEAGLRAILERRTWKAAQAHGEDPSDYIAMITDEIAKARAAGFLNDARFAQNQVYQQRSRGASRRAIGARLKAKGVDAALIETALCDDERDDAQAAWRYAQRRRLGPFRSKDRTERRDRDLAALCRAGFAFSVAQSIVDGEADEAPL